MEQWEKITDYILETFDERQIKAICLQMNRESIQQFKEYVKKNFMFNNAEDNTFCGVPIVCNNSINDYTVEVYF